MKYLDDIEEEVARHYTIAQKARKKGYDPEDKVDIPLAKGIAQRVEGLVGAVMPQVMKSGIAERIIELEKEYGSLDWRVALKIAEEVAKEKFCKFENKTRALETGIRVGLAYITLGVISAPLEGFIELRIKKRKDGKEYVAPFYAGPIRAAGGTAEAVSLVITDYVRTKTGYAAYDPSEKEIKRTITEIADYHDRVTNLQYRPSEEELEFLLRHLPVEVNGDPTEEMEVSNHKDLERVETNRIRGGVCLVLAEGLAQKAPKVFKRLGKWGKDFDLEWDFLDEFLQIQKKVKAKSSVKKAEEKISPNYTFIKDLVAGRPVLAFPMRFGGLRLRYGRTRTTGLAAAAMHPVSMQVLGEFIASGTQLKTERPGKAAAIVSCDTIEPPIVRLKDGSVIKLKENRKDVEKILFLGDILFNYGDFSENGHKLVPAGYCQEWWAKELKKTVEENYASLEEAAKAANLRLDVMEQLLSDPLKTIPSPIAFNLSEVFGVSLHPDHIYYWTGITTDDLKRIRAWVQQGNVKRDGEHIRKIVLENRQEKALLEKIGLPHLLVNNEYVVIEKDHAHTINRIFSKEVPDMDVLEALSDMAQVSIRDKAGTFIGARMGRPEKAKMRKLTGSPHFLFPVGEEGGRLRSIQSALEKGKITADFSVYVCTSCKRETIFSRCDKCGQKTFLAHYCRKCGVTKDKCSHDYVFQYRKKEININSLFRKSLKKAGIRIFPDLIKGVRGTSNKTHVPEYILKGVIRAKYDIYVNKDGTTRYDMIELPITHFKAQEIGTSIETLHELGYKEDIHGKPLETMDQVVELYPQDIILPASPESTDEPADEVLFRVCNAVDEMMQIIYGMEPFYNLKSKYDLRGHLIAGLAPHTSAGTVGRIIGFSKTQGMFTHPMYHAAMRRNCDGDEACAIMLMDALLNFSRSYLPDRRGSRTMDAPLVLTSQLNPEEVDDEVHGMDIVWDYPLELYEAAQQYKNPWDVNITQIDDVLGTPRQYRGMGFTHKVTSINSGVRCSAYKTLPTMQDKLLGQMELAEKISAVTAGEVAQLVIEKHFLKDIKGNLRKFSMQQFRCVKCNEKYRRPPLIGRCLKCHGKIIFTISEGSVVKYLEPTLSLAKKYEVTPYLQQSLQVLRRQVDSILGKETEVQTGLGSWFG